MAIATVQIILGVLTILLVRSNDVLSLETEISTDGIFATTVSDVIETSTFNNQQNSNKDDLTSDSRKEELKSDDAIVAVPNRLYFLDKVLDGYDKRAWPTHGKSGKSTTVNVNVNINSLGSVNAAHMEYKMDIYLRQSWTDRRLDMSKFGIGETLTLNGGDISKLIWTPDLFFRNVKHANFHYVTVPNMLVKISPQGQVLFSMRLTLTLSCHMSFRNYPLDTQKCLAVVGTYAQTTDQTVVKWQDNNPITVDDHVQVPEFDIVSITPGEFVRNLETGSFSFLNITFEFHRHRGFHVVQTYLPTFLIVMISWVSFWLNVDAVPARVTLGVTTLLTLTTVASGVRTQLPPVSYIKAIDVWIGACSLMVFGALLEFALVNFLSRSKPKAQEPKKTVQDLEVLDDPKMRAYATTVTVPQPATTPLNKADLVDRISRVSFPAFFFIFNIFYWPFYINTTE